MRAERRKVQPVLRPPAAHLESLTYALTSHFALLIFVVLASHFFSCTMTSDVERRTPVGLLEYLSLGVTTVGVGYVPLVPGSFGSVVGIGVYAFLAKAFR